MKIERQFQRFPWRRHRGTHADWLAGHRVVEAELAGVEGDRAETLVLELFAEGLRRAVLRVADNGVAAGGGLDANLMRPAGFELDFEPGAGGGPGEDSPMHDGQLAAGVVGRHDDRLGHAVAFVEVIGPGALVALNLAFD